MDITHDLKMFLQQEEIQYLINDNKWDKVYIKLRDQLKGRNVSNFTQLMLNTNINPLNYMNYVPKAYLLGTDIVTINIPNNITFIEPVAFAFCKSLKHVIIGNKVININARAFNDYESLIDITIPDSVTSIGDSAFAYCTSLKNLTLGKNIQHIEGEFLLHTKVKHISYNNTAENWKKIEIDPHYNLRLFGCTIHCTDGDLKYDKKLKEWNLIN